MKKGVFRKGFAIAIVLLFIGINLVSTVDSVSLKKTFLSDSLKEPLKQNNCINTKEETLGKTDWLALKASKILKPVQQTTHDGRGYFYAYLAYDPTGQYLPGWITFDLDGYWEYLSIGINPNFLSGTDIDAAGNWYAVDYSGGIYQIFFDGTMVFIASSISLSGLTFDSSTGIWYGSDSMNLYMVNITSGATTLVGLLGAPNSITDIACNIGGEMYGYDVVWSGNSTLYSIDKTTGYATPIGDMGEGFIYAQDCCFDRDNNILYLVGYTQSGTSGLYTCDISTGLVVLICSFGVLELDALAIPWQPFQYDHDVSLASIVEPKSGNAAPIIPVVKVKNSGLYDKYGVAVTMDITRNLYNQPLKESFETWLPTGWTVEEANEWSQGSNYTGGSSPEAILWNWNVADSYSYLQSPAVDTSAYSDLTLEFRSQIYCWGAITPMVKIRADTVDDWTDITPWTNPISTPQGPAKYVIDATAFIGPGTQVQFEFSGNYAYFYYWAIDDVKIWNIDSSMETYNPTVYCDVLVGDTVEVSLPEWTPSDLGVAENADIEYIVNAQTFLSGDQNPDNDAKTKKVYLHYGYFNDVRVNEINSPESGLAEPQIPEVAIENVGQLDQSANVNMVISKIQYGAQWTQESDTEWAQTFTNAAGGVSPEAWLPYNDIVGDYAYLMSAAIDTSAESSISLSFRSMINDYAGGYNCFIKTRSSESDPWTDVSPWTNPIYGSIYAAQYTIDISGDIGTDTQVMFEFDGYYYNLNYWYLDDFSVGVYSTDFSGTFPPVEMSLISEYNQTTTFAIATGEILNVSLPEWTPADLPFAASIDYQSDASVIMNVSDGNPSDNSMSKMFTLSYEHDVGVIEITKPDWHHPNSVEGIIQNLGVTYSEGDIPVNAYITKDWSLIYNGTVIVASPLAPGAIATVIFLDITYNMSEEGFYKLTMQTQLVGDDHPNNDKKTKTWEISYPDTTPPTTNATIIGTMGQNDWYISNVQVALTAIDGKWPHGVNNTWCKIDDGAWTEYNLPFTVCDDGEHTVYFYSDDRAIPPNVEEVKSVDFKIDQTDPSISVTAEKVGFRQWKFTANVLDETSGVVLIEFYLDDILLGNITEPGPYIWDWTGKGNHTVTGIAYDAAGKSAENSVVFSLSLSQNQYSLYQFVSHLLNLLQWLKSTFIKIFIQAEKLLC